MKKISDTIKNKRNLAELSKRSALSSCRVEGINPSVEEEIYISK